MVFNATFNNIVLLVKEYLEKIIDLPWVGIKFTTLVVTGTDCIGNCKSNYHDHDGPLLEIACICRYQWSIIYICLQFARDLNIIHWILFKMYSFENSTLILRLIERNLNCMNANTTIALYVWLARKQGKNHCPKKKLNILHCIFIFFN